MTPLDRLREKAENATPGPWAEHVADCDSFMSTFYIGKPNQEWPLKPEEVVCITGCNGCQYGQMRDEDSTFIVAFNPQVALALVEYVQAHRKLQRAAARMGSDYLDTADYRDCLVAFHDAEARLFSLLGEDA